MSIWQKIRQVSLPIIRLLLITICMGSLLHMPTLRAANTAQAMHLNIVATAPAIVPAANAKRPISEPLTSKTSPLDDPTPLFERFAQAEIQSDIPVKPTDPVEAAKIDARAEVNPPLWFTIGCLIGILGVVAAVMIPPSPPVTAIMGQTPDYAEAYTFAYQQAAKEVRGKATLIGIGARAATAVIVSVAGAVYLLIGYSAALGAF